MTGNPGRWSAYIDAVLRIKAPSGVIWVRPAPISLVSGEYPEPQGRAIYVITAHNPAGQVASDEDNAAAQAQLVAELEKRGLTWWPAAGGDPSWTHVEDSVAVIGMDEAEAIALGAQFGQDAIFVLTPADRQVVGCAERRIVATGWSIEPEADSPQVSERPVLDLIEVRRALHRIPELAFEEHQTSEMLLGIITSLVGARADIEITRYRTGIIVHVPATAGLDGGPAGAGGKTIGWRADMDGLPLAEETGLPFASAHPGLMHACGHDVHMTCGLGILEQVLARPQRHSFVFLFQPAEENISGAQQIYDAGLLDKYGISEFYALHVSPEWDAGVIATRPGTLLAGSSSVTVEFTGVAGHAGMPHRAVDPIVAVASFVLQIQAMIARNFDPAVGGVVLTFGTISGGTVVNGVAASAKVMGTLRFLDAAQHDLAFRRIREIAEGVALATGATADVRLEDSPWVPTRNDPQITARFTDYMRNRPGVTFQDAPVTMGSEDYGYLIDRIPGMMFLLGTGRGHSLHSEKFSPDERAIEPTVRLIGGYLAQL